MSNDEGLLSTYNTKLINQFSISVSDEIMPILQQHPELVVVNYRSIDWRQPQYKSALVAELNKKISNLADYATLMPMIKEYLGLFLVPSFFDSPDFQNLAAIIQELITALNVMELSNPDMIAPITSSFSPPAIAILLLDAENLQINATMEKFLATVSSYPLQVKIAFANWSKMGKQDVELHQRGYELIHVPVGKDNADGKMIALGASVHERYTHAKEVIVCSSDKVMTNLCNHLQQNGLIVYQVIKKAEILIVLDSSTGKEITQFPQSTPEIPTIEIFLEQIKQLIQAEQEQNQIYWVKLSTLSKIFKTKYNLTISQVVSTHLPGKKARDIFMNYPADFAIHQVDANSELYITLFQVNQLIAKNGKVSNNKSPLLSKINSAADLEKALNNIFQELTIKSPSSYIDIGPLGAGFNQHYGKPITEQIKTLKLKGNFIKFLQSCNSFKLKQTGKTWQIALR